MFGGSAILTDETSVGDVEHHKPMSVKSSNDGMNAGNKTRQVLRKKGGRKLRPAAPRHQQRSERSGRLTDHNNNNNNPLTASSATNPALGPETSRALSALSLHHLKQESKKEVISQMVLGEHHATSTCSPPPPLSSRFSCLFRCINHSLEPRFGIISLQHRRQISDAVISHADMKPASIIRRGSFDVNKPKRIHVCLDIHTVLICALKNIFDTDYCSY